MTHSFQNNSNSGGSNGTVTPMSRRVSRHTNDGDLVSLQKALEKAIALQGPSAGDFKFTQVPTSDGIRLPILAVWAKFGQTIYSFGYVLWNGQQIPDYVDQNSQIRIARYAGDVCDAYASNAMIERVRRDSGAGSDQQIISVSLAVISTEVDYENQEQMTDLLYVAGNAIETNAEQRKDLPSDTTTLDSLRKASGRLQSSVSFGNGNIMNMFSLPTRADIRVEVTQTSGAKNQNQLHGNDEVLTVLDAYLEPSFAPAEMVEQNVRAAAQALAYPGAPEPKPLRRFVMTLVVTNFDYYGSKGAVNLESKFMALASVASMLRSPFQWAEAYRNTYGQANPWRNVGGLAREVPPLTDKKASPDAVPGKAVDAHAPNFGTDQLVKFVDQVCWPDIAIALDIDENGPWSWLESVLTQSTGIYDRDNNQISTRARKYIISALDRVTNNAFSKHFPANGQIFQGQTFRMHRGYFELDGRGVLDIRELGQLELFNAGTDNASYELAIEYAKTFEETNRPEYERQARRLEIFQQTLGGGKNLIKVVGNTRRLICTKDFINALLVSFNEAGLSYQGDAIRIGSGGNASRGAQYLNGAILAPNLGHSYVAAPTSGQGASVGYVPPVGDVGVWG